MLGIINGSYQRRFIVFIIVFGLVFIATNISKIGTEVEEYKGWGRYALETYSLSKFVLDSLAVITGGALFAFYTILMQRCLGIIFQHIRRLKFSISSIVLTAIIVFIHWMLLTALWGERAEIESYLSELGIITYQSLILCIILSIFIIWIWNRHVKRKREYHKLTFKPLEKKGKIILIVILSILLASLVILGVFGIITFETVVVVIGYLMMIGLLFYIIRLLEVQEKVDAELWEEIREADKLFEEVKKKIS